MAPKASTSLLFHPKKKPRAAPPPPQPVTTKSAAPDEEDETLNLPDCPFQEFRLMSSAMHGWRYNVMKFDSRKPVEVAEWQQPIKLNRKDPRRDDVPAQVKQETIKPMLGPDGKPVLDSHGNLVMAGLDGRPIHANAQGSTSGQAAGGQKDVKGKGPGGRKKFQKKTKQVFLVPEATRQLRREERYPWVIEDASGQEVWQAQMEEVSKSETHCMFMPGPSEIFKFVPAHRWYKFQKRPKHRVPNLDEAESVMAQIQKNREPERWLLRRKGPGQTMSAETAAMFKGETVESSTSLVRDLRPKTNESFVDGRRRRLRGVDSGMSGLFGDDDEDQEMKKRKAKELGEEGDMDEQVYEEDFADDDEKMEMENDDEEAKELEERLKREYKSANKAREGGVDESDEDEDEAKLTKDGKKMVKLMRNLEKNDAYASDEEENPYASSEEEEEEEEEEEIPPSTEPAIPPPPPSRPGSQPPPSKPSTPATPAPGSRATSPVPPGMGGHSVVAKRATSPNAPKAPKLKTNGTSSRATSPLGSRANSPPLSGSRGTSPAPLGSTNGTGSRAASPTASVNGVTQSNKRKAPDDSPTSPSAAGPSAAPKMKKRKSIMPGAAPAGELTEWMLVDWLRSTSNATTRDCISHFRTYATDPTSKSAFADLVKKVASLREDKTLVLRKPYREGSTATSPAPEGS